MHDVNEKTTQRVLTVSQLCSFMDLFLREFEREIVSSKSGVTFVRIVLELFVHGTLDQTEIVTRLGYPPESVSRHLAQLGPGRYTLEGLKTGLGIIETYRDHRSTRNNRVRLTDRGVEIVQGLLTKSLPPVALEPK